MWSWNSVVVILICCCCCCWKAEFAGIGKMASRSRWRCYLFRFWWWSRAADLFLLFTFLSLTLFSCLFNSRKKNEGVHAHSTSTVMIHLTDIRQKSITKCHLLMLKWIWQLELEGWGYFEFLIFEKDDNIELFHVPKTVRKYS